MLTVVPALRALRRRFPDRQLLLAGPRGPGQLLQQYGIVDGVIATPGLGAAPPGRGVSGHLAVNLHGRGPQSHRLMLTGNPSRLIAYANREVAVPGPVWSAREHEVYRWCRLVTWGADEAVVNLCDPTDLYLEERARRTVDTPRLSDALAPGASSGSAEADGARGRTGPVVIHPGAASAARRWPAERFAAVAAVLARRGYPVVVTGGSGEASMCRRMVSRAGLGPAADLAGQLTLPNLVALLRRSRLLICSDTGVAHLATALRTPSVQLFGPAPPQLWGPPVDQHLHLVLWHGRLDAPGDPHGPVPDPALLEITVRETLQAALLHLAHTRDPHDASFA